MKNRKLRKRLMLFAGMLSLMGKPDMRVEALKKRDWNLEDQGDENKVGEPKPDENEKDRKKDETTGTNIGKYVGGTIFLLLVGGIGLALWKKNTETDNDKQVDSNKKDGVQAEDVKVEDVKAGDANGSLIMNQNNTKTSDPNQYDNLKPQPLNDGNSNNTDINANLLQTDINKEKKEAEDSKRDIFLQNQSKEQNQEDLEKLEEDKKKKNRKP